MDNQPQLPPADFTPPTEAGAGVFGAPPPPAPPPGYYPPPPRQPAGVNPALWVVIACCGGLFLVAVLGIVATIAIPLMLSSRAGAVNEKARNALRSVVSAEAAYFAANGHYGSLADLRSGTSPFLDGSFVEGADIGGGVVIHVDAKGAAFTATATAKTGTVPYHSFVADESGMITMQ